MFCVCCKQPKPAVFGSGLQLFGFEYWDVKQLVSLGALLWNWVDIAFLLYPIRKGYGYYTQTIIVINI